MGSDATGALAAPTACATLCQIRYIGYSFSLSYYIDFRMTGGAMSVSGGSARLAGRVALVTGAGSSGELAGVGMACALTLARHGAQVAVADVSAERAQATHATLRAAGATASVTVGDVSVEADCRRMVAETVQRFGTLDILVNNAAIVAAQPGTDLDREEWDRCFAVNLTGAALMSKYALRQMVDQHRGAIVNISSIAALQTMGAGAYSASKAGLMALTKDLAFQYGRAGVRVNCVAPGYLHAPMGLHGGEASRELRRRCVLLDVEGTAYDVADAVAFLVSDEARWITAVTLPVDAGTTAGTVQEGWPWAAELGQALRALPRA
jgi:NAD(P)-dependent dehydrogenase (short-subunit alcohol dehydrogenase family)